MTPEPASDAPLLAVRDLSVSFGPQPVVRVDELTLHAGEMLGLAGESGAGKSLTGLTVLGLSRHTGARVTGSVRLAGEELVTAPERRLRQLRGSAVALIPETPGSAFSPVLPVGTTVLRALRLHGRTRAEARRQAATGLERAGLAAEHLGRYPHQLSGGQLQQVTIALALALGARLLVADEPTSALDVSARGRICDLIAELCAAEGIAALFISHDLAVLAGLCDRIAVMHQGRVIEDRPTAELIAGPRTEYARQLLAAVPRLGDGKGRGGPGREAVTDA